MRHPKHHAVKVHEARVYPEPMLCEHGPCTATGIIRPVKGLPSFEWPCFCAKHSIA